MLGNFVVRYQGKEVVLGRNTTSKFVQILQIVWLSGKDGISKELLIKSLYDVESQANINNSFNNVIYQMRRQMIKAGLPDRNYIKKKGGVFYTDENIDIKVDVLDFKELCYQAEKETDEEKKYDMYMEALALYKGDLLPDLNTEIWVITESAQLEKMFKEAVSYAGAYARKDKSYDIMYRIYTKAAEIHPDQYWQVDQIDALILMGYFKEANSLYDKTVRFYSDEMGIPISEKMLECYERMSEKIVNEPGKITEIQSDIRQKNRPEEKDLAYNCSYPGFIDAYHVLCRNMERSGYSVFMMLCTIVDYEGKVIQNEEKLKQRSEALKKAIAVTLRQGDTYTKYSESQYLILLVGTSQEDCEIIYKRLVNKLKEIAGTRVELKYNVVSLAELEQSPRKK
ncbi:MAG: bacterial transcriptional activator domain-containing protein [Butyrivibrio sp.]|nr:bacterial transcriptional activator domain-containing protein [Butyrivibrio sp.]